MPASRSPRTMIKAGDSSIVDNAATHAMTASPAALEASLPAAAPQLLPPLQNRTLPLWCTDFGALNAAQIILPASRAARVATLSASCRSSPVLAVMTASPCAPRADGLFLLCCCRWKSPAVQAASAERQTTCSLNEKLKHNARPAMRSRRQRFRDDLLCAAAGWVYVEA